MDEEGENLDEEKLEVKSQDNHQDWKINLRSIRMNKNETIEKFHHLKWKEIMHLYRILRAPTFCHIRMEGDDRALYESFFRAFPQDMVSKARFVGVFRTIFGVEETKPNKKSEELELCRYLDNMQYLFDVSTENVAMLNWRIFLSSIRMLQQPLVVIREHLSWTFSLFSSSSFLELKDQSTIKIRDVSVLLTHFIPSPAAVRVICDRISQAQSKITTSHVASRITHKTFRELIAQEPLSVLFDQADAYTSYYDELSSPVYRKYIVKIRKKHSDLRKARRFRFMYDTRDVRKCFFQWQNVTQIRRRTRLILKDAMDQMVKCKCQWAFRKLQQYSIQFFCVSEIQRVFRGFRGRQKAAEKYTYVQAVMKVQHAYRGRSTFVRHSRELVQRNLLSIRIQKIYRGWRGRIKARKILLDFFYKEMDVIQKNREAFYEHIRQQMCRVIQRFFRAVIVKKRERIRKGQELAIRRIEMEMEEARRKAERERLYHRREVSEMYERLRKDTEARKQQREKDKEEKSKIIRLRCSRQWDKFKKEKEENKLRLKELAATEYQELKHLWQTKIEERVRQKHMFISQILQAEEPGEWKDLQNRLREEVQIRRKALSAKLKATGVDIQKNEIEERAKREIIAEQTDQERANAEAEWLQAEADFIRALDEKEEEEKLKGNTEAKALRQKSVIRIQCAFRMFAAQKLLREEIRSVYVKEFDPSTKVAIYRNAIMGTSSIRKPYGLGSEDLEFPDQWVVMTDVSGESYYYNPRKMIMSWSKPDECRFCERCDKFAAVWDSNKDTYLCDECYNQNANLWQNYFAYNGSRPHGN